MAKNKRLPQENPAHWQDRIFLVIFAICICNQGSFFEGGILAAVLIMSVMCLFKKITPSKSDIVMLVFCVWYFVCSITGGFCLEYAAKGLLPSASFMFYLLASNSVKNSEKFENEFIKIALVISGISIIDCLVMSVNSGSLQRGLFPFGYSNACGIFFGIMFLFSAKRSGFKYMKFIFLMALILTQSVGAIGISVALWVISDIKNKRNLFILLGAVVFCVLFKDRLLESAYTFTERLLQMYDGLICVKDNPALGVGAGRWSVIKPLYQSGFYNASVIHNSYVQLAVNSGIGGLVLFISALIVPVFKTFKKDKTKFLCVSALLLHALVDLTFSYGALGMLAAFILRNEEEKNKKIFWAPTFAYLLIAAFAFTLLVGLSPVKTMENNIAKGKAAEVVTLYNKKPMLKYSIGAKKEYIKALYLLKDYDRALKEIETIKLKSGDMYSISSWCGDKNALVVGLKLQPYNLNLYEEVNKTNSESLKKEAESIKETAIKNMSFLGDFLYKEKGENNK